MALVYWPDRARLSASAVSLLGFARISQSHGGVVFQVSCPCEIFGVEFVFVKDSSWLASHVIRHNNVPLCYTNEGFDLLFTLW